MDSDIKEIAKRIENAGGKLYLVGGAVRDQILNREISDRDYSVVGLSNEEFLKLFPDAKPRGKSFQVYDINGQEFAIARKERKTGIGHKDFEVETGKHIQIEEDLLRRDITINSIAENVLTGEIIDPFNGTDDLNNGIIKATSEKFMEDPLRVYRVARFAATFDFKVENQTVSKMKSLRDDLNTLSKERVFSELRKALNTDNPENFFNTLKEAEVLDIHFKEIFDLIGAIQPPEYHPEGDSYVHTMLALKNSVLLTKDELIRFCTLVHDLGKGTTPKELYPHHYGHDERGVEPLKSFSKRIGIPKEWYQNAKMVILEHMRGGKFYAMTAPKKVDFIARVSKSTIGLDGLQIVVYADRYRGDSSALKNPKYDFLDIGNKMLSEIDGEYIKQKYNIEPGIKFGRKLREERIKWIKER